MEQIGIEQLTREGRIISPWTLIDGVYNRDGTPVSQNVLGMVPASRTVNGQALAGDVTLSAADVHARPEDWTPDLAQVGGSGRNLLDNWCWAVREAIVNQRGQESYTTGYTIDRWSLSVGNASLALDAGSIRLTKTASTGYPMVLQYLEPALTDFLTGKQVTLSVFTPEGLFSTVHTVPAGAFDSANTRLGTARFSADLMKDADGRMRFRILAENNAAVGDGISLLATKLELGSAQTLARQENGAWVLNDPPPDYQQELAKCQRYQLALDGLMRVRAVLVLTDRIDFLIPTPVTMRANPTIRINNLYVITVASGSVVSGFTFAVSQKSGAGVMVSASKTAHGLSDAALQCAGDGAIALLDANL